MSMSYVVPGDSGTLTLDAVGNGFDAKCPICGTVSHLRMSAPYPEDNFVDVDKVSMTCPGPEDEGPCGYSVMAGQLVGTY